MFPATPQSESTFTQTEPWANVIPISTVTEFESVGVPAANVMPAGSTHSYPAASSIANVENSTVVPGQIPADAEIETGRSAIVDVVLLFQRMRLSSPQSATALTPISPVVKVLSIDTVIAFVFKPLVMVMPGGTIQS